MQQIISYWHTKSVQVIFFDDTAIFFSLSTQLFHILAVDNCSNFDVCLFTVCTTKNHGFYAPYSCSYHFLIMWTFFMVFLCLGRKNGGCFVCVFKIRRTIVKWFFCITFLAWDFGTSQELNLNFNICAIYVPCSSIGRNRETKQIPYSFHAQWLLRF